jgi:hypothetical protein
VLEIQPPGAEAWTLIALMSLVPLAVGQGVLGVRGYFENSEEEGTTLDLFR